MRFLKHALAVAALLFGNPAFAGDYGYQQPYLNIINTNTLDGVTVNPSNSAPGNFTTLNATGLANLSGGMQLNNLNFSPTPGGRLTLSSTLPVMTADVAVGTTVYYLPYTSRSVPIYNGTNWLTYDITASGLSLTNNSTNMPAGSVYDVYAVNVSGTPTLCAMSWGTPTSRSTTVGGASGAANASITQINGLWVNNAAIATANCYNGTTTYVIPQNQGTLLGSFYNSVNGQTSYVCKPTGASGGTQLLIEVSNAYNRVPLNCSNRDTATSVTSASSSWALLGANDSIVFVDSLQQIGFSYDAHVVAGNGTAAGDVGNFGVALSGSGTGTPSVIASTAAPTATLADNYSTLSVHEGFYPALGRSVLYEEKMSTTGTTTYMPVTTQEDFTINAAY